MTSVKKSKTKTVIKKSKSKTKSVVKTKTVVKKSSVKKPVPVKSSKFLKGVATHKKVLLALLASGLVGSGIALALQKKKPKHLGQENKGFQMIEGYLNKNEAKSNTEKVLKNYIEEIKAGLEPSYTQQQSAMRSHDKPSEGLGYKGVNIKKVYETSDYFKSPLTHFKLSKVGIKGTQ